MVEIGKKWMWRVGVGVQLGVLKYLKLTFQDPAMSPLCLVSSLCLGIGFKENHLGQIGKVFRVVNTFSQSSALAVVRSVIVPDLVL